jgi:hypothetical protein
MSGVRHSGSHPHAHKPAKKPAQPKPAASRPRPEPEDDGLFRDEESDDGWHKTDGPGSSGGYGVRSAPTSGNGLKPNPSPDQNDWGCDDLDALFTDRCDIDFKRKK